MKKPTSHDDYLLYINEPQYSLMQKLRASIHAACPTATEVISYSMPAFKYNGRQLVGYAVAKEWCSLFPWTNSVVILLEKEPAKYSTSKGTIRFTPQKPLTEALIKKIVKMRMKQIDEKLAEKKTRTT